MQITNRRIDPIKLEKAAEILKVIAHPVRLRILELLECNEQLTVTQLMHELEIEQSLLSHHLSKMRDKRVLNSSRDGKHIRYQLADNKITTIFDCMENCLA